MKLVVGLGNPGPRYEGSRHNVGFAIADLLADRAGIDLSRHNTKFDALCGDGPIAGQRTLLLKPTTFMNLSGRSVSAAVRFYKIALDDVLVVYDDLDLPPGKLRFRGQGSAGGHNGMRDIIQKLSSDAFPRLRIGIGKSQRGQTVSHVLGGFSPAEREIIEHAYQLAADGVETWLRSGLNKAMNEFNKRDVSE